MADPYNPYTQYSTPAPGGVGYYPPEDQAHQPAYPYQQDAYANHGTAEPQPGAGHTYDAQMQPSQYHLAPDVYQNNAPERSHTPSGQPDYLGPVAAYGNQSAQDGKVPSNLEYYNPDSQPRYSPVPSTHPPSVHVSEAPDPRYEDDRRSIGENGDAETDRGLGSSLAGGAAGYYFGHKKDHGLLGAIGGAIAANFIEGKIKNRHDDDSSITMGITITTTIIMDTIVGAQVVILEVILDTAMKMTIDSVR
ncbi:hypothetical protein N7456_007991 [Penicillium angulare]|uniref:Glycine zipper 2TM domain-containing protein n=1 Tax=Penicillium angulare TaxID=116970 RepID=A0A9W9FBY2_9EURO|nr:hypothetical protein N7456_007991 [Penicillium angulare]